MPGILARELLATLDRELTAFQVGAQADDTAALALRRDPSTDREDPRG